jgi:tetratricopeptide (TPR) repeat protein
MNTWLRRIGRVVFGAGPLLISLYLFRRALQAGQQEESLLLSSNHKVITDLILAVGLLVVAGIALAPTIAQLVTTPVRDWIDTLYGSGGDEEVVPELQPAWKLAKKYLAESRWEEAIEVLQRIVTYYPQERDAYAAGMDAARQAGDLEALQWFGEEARKSVTDK